MIDPLWIGGFTSAEGCFRVKIVKSVTHKIGFKVELEFSLSQYARDELLIRAIRNYLNFGWVRNNRETFEFRVRRLTDILNKLIPLFQINKINGQSAFNSQTDALYQRWWKKRTPH